LRWFSKILGRRPHPAVDVAGMEVTPERLAALRPDDQFLVSYPRSGNRWVRHLLRDVIALGRPDLPPPEKLGMLIPDLHVNEMDHLARMDFGMSTQIFKSHNLPDLRGRRIVYLFREPADALVSYFHFHVREKIEPELVAQWPDAFCRAMLPGWCEHVQMALDEYADEYAVTPSRVLLVSYEILLRDGARGDHAFFRTDGGRGGACRSHRPEQVRDPAGKGGAESTSPRRVPLSEGPHRDRARRVDHRNAAGHRCEGTTDLRPSAGRGRERAIDSRSATREH
jgi:hypothetical protein